MSADAAGQYEWPDLTGSTVTLMVSAQGYLAGEVTEEIDRGHNEITLGLERDPYGLLPSEACAPGETLVYVDDFEDGAAQGCQEIELGALGFSFAPDPDAAENTVAQMQAAPGAEVSSIRRDFPENLSWRLDFRVESGAALNFSISQASSEKGESVYQVILAAPGLPNASELRRMFIPESNVGVRPLRNATVGVWQTLEASRFEDTVQIWVDGELVASYQDPMPIPSTGNTALGLLPTGDDSIAYIDNMSACELSAAFEPRPTPAPAPDA